MAKPKMFNNFDAPVPGENYTSDTKNYPWHRAPDFDDVDVAVEYMMKKLLDDTTSQSLLTFISMGATVASVTDLLVTEGIAKGKWTPDFAILLAGPIARIICLVCKANDVEYNLGVEKKYTGPTKVLFKELAKTAENKKLEEKGQMSPLVSQLLATKGINTDSKGPMTDAVAPSSGFAGLAQQPVAPTGVPGMNEELV